MDLVERRGWAVRRHPWETARVEAVKRIIRRLPLRDPRVLELGCGDAFVLAELQRSLGFRDALAYDLHFTEELIRELEAAYPDVRFLRALDDLSGPRAKLILLLDVLEHIEEPVPYLRQVVAKQLASDGWVMATVPAFQALFSRHDHRLRHFRRYSRAEIAEVVAGAGLEIVDSGYLFASLVLPRALGKLKERILPVPDRADSTSLGRWGGSALLTRTLHRALCWDNWLCLASHDHGIDVPGLSVWLTCKRPS